LAEDDGEKGFVFDIGMHDGQGFPVISVEANPHLCALARRQFSGAIKSGQLTILNVAIDDTEGERDFYVNLHDDHWSSLYPELGKHAGKFTTIKVKTQRFEPLIAAYGVPHYLKVDIEGGDLTVLHHLANVPEKPHFISVEENGLEYFPLLWSLGYRASRSSTKASSKSAIIPAGDLSRERQDHSATRRKEGQASGPIGGAASNQPHPIAIAFHAQAVTIIFDS